MADHGSVFKRVEKKYRLAPQQRSAIEVAALERMSVDCYGRSLITSLYLDTPAHDMIARSVEKPLYKEKLRLRAYGADASHALMHVFCDKPLSRAGDKPPLSDAGVSERCAAACADEAPGASEVPIFFEIKKKFKGVVYKRRLVLSLPAALAFASGLSFEQAHLRWPLAKEDGTVATPSKQERQIARELEAAMDRWGEIVPSMGIACWREAWALREHAVEDAFDPSCASPSTTRSNATTASPSDPPGRASSAATRRSWRSRAQGPTLPGWSRRSLPSGSIPRRSPSTEPPTNYARRKEPRYVRHKLHLDLRQC